MTWHELFTLISQLVCEWFSVMILGFMECSMASAVIPVRRTFLGGGIGGLRPDTRFGRKPGCRRSICVGIRRNNGDKSDELERRLFSDRPEPGRDMSSRSPAQGSRSVPSRPSIPGRFSKYSSKAESFKKLAPGRGGPRPFLPSKPFSPSRGYHTIPTDTGHSSPPFDIGPNPGSPPPSAFQDFPSEHWSRKHIDESEELPRVRPPQLPRKHLELPSPRSPNRLQQGFASRGIRVERLQNRPRYELPFEFQYTYSETPKEEPIAQRGPQFSPFGPDSMPRPWTGKKPLPPSKKRHHEIDSFNPPPPNLKGVKSVEPAGPFPEGQRPILATTREEVMGEPLTLDEIADLVAACNKEQRQVNIGRDGLTHNMLDLIHNHWKRRRVIKLKCKGVPTIDMDNICFHIEDKTGGKIIRRHGGAVYLFRGRNYNPMYRPQIPLMLWKPPVPIYPRLIEQAPAGLTVEHAEYLRRRGRRVKALATLSRNGVYLDLVRDVKAAFEVDELVKLDCRGMNSTDIRKIGAKLKEILGIVLLSFENECVLMWRGPPKKADDDKALEQFIFKSVSEGNEEENTERSQQNGGPTQSEALQRATKDLDNLWDRAIHFGMMTTLEDDQLDPDTIKAIVGAAAKVTQPRTEDEEEDDRDRAEMEEERRVEERRILDKRLAAPVPPAPVAGVLPVDELAKLLASPP